MPERGEKRFYASGGDILAKKKHQGTESVSSWVKYPGGEQASRKGASGAFPLRTGGAPETGAGPQGKDEGGAPC